MTRYLILDLACRQGELASAFALRSKSKLKHGFDCRTVDAVLSAVVTSNWIAFWRARRRVDGYERALLHWAVDGIRRDTLKALGKAYMACDVKWVLQSTTGGEMDWEYLVQKENVGWIRDGERIIIRKPKMKVLTSDQGG